MTHHPESPNPRATELGIPAGAGRAAEQLRAAGEHALVEQLTALAEAVLTEAARSPRFRDRLRQALASPAPTGSESHLAGSRQVGRRPQRQPPVLDPHRVLADDGPAALREQLQVLDLNQLRDIAAAHRMNEDGLALKWKTPHKLVDRILERTQSRATKGDEFR